MALYSPKYAEAADDKPHQQTTGWLRRSSHGRVAVGARDQDWVRRIILRLGALYHNRRRLLRACVPTNSQRCNAHKAAKDHRFRPAGWLGNRVVNVLDSVAVGTGFKSQPRRCRVTVLGKLFTPSCPCSRSIEIGSSPLKCCEGNCRPVTQCISVVASTHTLTTLMIL